MAHAKQSVADQAKRLNGGRCPVHGLGMGQVDRYYETDDGQPFTIVGCPRRDCGIRAKAYGLNGPWELVDDSEEAQWWMQGTRELVETYLAARGLKSVPITDPAVSPSVHHN